MAWVEIIGYLASILIAVSLMMANIKRLRWINMLGAVTFSIYGYLIDAYPVFVLNGWTACVNLYFLIRLYRFKDQFDLVQEPSADSPFYLLLLRRYRDDIKQFFPDVGVDTLHDASALVIFRNMKPVGLFAYKAVAGGKTAEILLDYVIPQARDFKTARFFFDQHSRQLREDSFVDLLARSSVAAHTRYLLKMGFVQRGGSYQLAL